jgi:hypothetical protein
MRDEPEFPDGASLWTRTGLAADWLAGRMNAAPANSSRSYEMSPISEEASFREHELQPRLQHGKGGIAFVGGLADEQGAKAVYESYLAYIASGRPAAYFTESQGRALARWLDDNAGHVTAVYGHSYGADTAAKAFADGHGAGADLYTVDPVSRFRPDFAAVRRHARRWHNYNSTSDTHSSDRIANIGGRWGDAPAQYATHVALPHHHMQIWREVVPWHKREQRR